MRFKSASAPGSNSIVVRPLVEEGQKTVSVPFVSPDCSTRRISSRVRSWTSVLPLCIEGNVSGFYCHNILSEEHEDYHKGHQGHNGSRSKLGVPLKPFVSAKS